MQNLQPGFEPGLLDPESRTVTIRINTVTIIYILMIKVLTPTEV